MSAARLLFSPRPGETVRRCRTCGWVMPESAFNYNAHGSMRLDCRQCQDGVPPLWLADLPAPTIDDWREFVALRRRIFHESDAPAGRNIQRMVL